MLDLTKKQNKGEWSETLSLLKILSSPDWKISKGNKFGEKTDEYLEIVEIKASLDSKITYINKSETEFLINQKVYPKKDIDDIFNFFFEEVLNSKDTTFILTNEDVINLLESFELPGKASNQRKADLFFKFSNEGSFEGVSIKSSIGGLSSLVNSTKHTLISYDLTTNENFNLSKANPKGRDKYIKSVEYVDENTSNWDSTIESDIYRESLIGINEDLPELLGSLLFYSYLCRPPTFINIFENYAFIDREKEIIKEFLEASFCGLMPSKKWDSVMECKCLVDLKKDQSLLLYRYEENDSTLKDFLFNTVKFETPSSKNSTIDEIVKAVDNRKKLFLSVQLRLD